MRDTVDIAPEFLDRVRSKYNAMLFTDSIIQTDIIDTYLDDDDQIIPRDEAEKTDESIPMYREIFIEE